ncbi:DUF6456 domain-containing protein [Pelagibacterium xiamenense]|uniref:DUF6456 domain-containing protein n=1 Tax=Pelagibacterium xiamenense TaxID=2901140 RepID=UPI001E65604A|nr:DUF6456 domain-containing protein [Pelagibacterium xiamenense]MCD7059427.1 DUF6456 domain-containing protein [Pelagibacterium xiamenense]
MSATERQMRFVHALLRGRQETVATLSERERAELIDAGVVTEAGEGPRATAAAREWLRRARAAGGSEAAQPPAGEPLPLLAALARASGSRPAFLAPHHLEAARRVQRLFDKAHLTPRTTMAYSPIVTGGAPNGQASADITDMAASARKALAALHARLPRDCAGVVIDVCGYEKGLQAVETERGWPRRSAKLVLRIGLDQLARHYGLAPEVSGPDTARVSKWREEGARPREFY